MNARAFTALMALAAVSAAHARKLATPEPVVPKTYVQTGNAASTDAADVARWWAEFHDPELNSLVERAIQHNTDLRIAAARVLEARALQGVERAKLLPTLSSSNSFDRIRGGYSQGVVHVSPGQSLISPFETNTVQLGFDASWELDFFGGKRKAVQAAAADAAAVEESRRDALVTVIAEVARNYIELRGLDRRLEITRRNIQTQKDTLDLTRVRAEAGLGTQLEVEQQRTQLSTTQAAEPMLESTRIQTVQRLGVLTGEPPDSLLGELRESAALPPTPPVVAVGLPSDLLRRRPDLRQAEAETAAAAARVGVARADLFPKFVITGLAGRQSTNASGFTLGAGNFFSAGPGIQLPIFSGGKIRANIAANEARLQEAIARYEGAMLNALGDVENALTAYNREQQRRDQLQTAAKAASSATALANELYKRGLSDFLSVLDAQRAQYAAEDDLVQSETTVVTDLVALYKALGGGW
jgi:NodT family efflux transporter outer membrane factor (OMF) lipoprotein